MDDKKTEFKLKKFDLKEFSKEVEVDPKYDFEIEHKDD